MSQKSMPNPTPNNQLPADKTSCSPPKVQGPYPSSNGAFRERQWALSLSQTALSPDPSSSATPREPSSLSVSSNTASSIEPESPKPKKKKSKSMLRFFALKEPSHSALEQYAQQQRKQLAANWGETSLGGTNATTQKMPPTVPKVNSKWDGLPESSKAKNSSSKKNKKTTPVSIFTSINSDLRRKIPTSPDSFHNGRERVTLGTQEPGKMKYKSFDVSGSASTLPEMTCFFPKDPNASRATDKPLPETPMPKIAQNCEAVAESDSSTLNGHSANFFAASQERRTAPRPRRKPPLKITVADATRVKSPPSKVPPYSVSDGQLNQVPSPPTTELVILASPQGRKTLVRPQTPNFSRPLSNHSYKQWPDSAYFPSPKWWPDHQPSQPPSRADSHPWPSPLARLSIVPSQLEPPLNQDSDLAATTNKHTTLDQDKGPHEQHHERRRKEEDDTLSPTPSRTPSEMSDSWFQSPRERLGLGGQIRKNEDEVSPWNVDGKSSGDVDADASVQAETGKRKKRGLSMFGRG